MSPIRKSTLILAAVTIVCGWHAPQAAAQSFGLELHNTLMPASGGMGGTSIARPQDLLSAINANPAALIQYDGTTFTFSGAWTEPTVNLSHTGGVLPQVGNFRGKSEAQGSALGNIGVAQQMSLMGRRATIGMGLISTAGAGGDWRDEPASNGTSIIASVLSITAGGSVQLSDKLAAGATISLGTANLSAPFIGIHSGSVDYGLRGKLGLSYDVNCNTTAGFYYETQKAYRFNNAIIFDLPGGGRSQAFDLSLDLPTNIGFGLANTSLMGGNLLLAVDVLYKGWDDATFFDVVYDDQWVVSTGAQLTRGKTKLRLGYTWAQNPVRSTPGGSAGGVAPPGAVAAMEYVQALVGVVSEHRISAGVGIEEILPNIDIDLFAGGMFEESQDMGDFTSMSIESYWIGFGTTWHFGPCGRDSGCGDSGCGAGSCGIGKSCF